MSREYGRDFAAVIVLDYKKSIKTYRENI